MLHLVETNIYIIQMKIRVLTAVIIALIFNACVSIPKETVELSNVLEKDIIALHNSHKNMVDLYYGQLERDINNFVDEVYAPFIIHYVLKSELTRYKKGEESLYGIIEQAGRKEGQDEAKEALKVMSEFIEDANQQINTKRRELLNPVLQQKRNLISRIDRSYKNAIYANNVISTYLKSIRKIKETQKEALSLMGLEGADEIFNSSLLKASEIINDAIRKGKQIDVESDAAFNEIMKITERIEKIINEN